jgi:hypothetical protein
MVSVLVIVYECSTCSEGVTAKLVRQVPHKRIDARHRNSDTSGALQIEAAGSCDCFRITSQPKDNFPNCRLLGKGSSVSQIRWYTFSHFRIIAVLPISEEFARLYRSRNKRPPHGGVFGAIPLTSRTHSSSSSLQPEYIQMRLMGSDSTISPPRMIISWPKQFDVSHLRT